MPTPESWYRAAERILELEKAGKVRLEPEYVVESRDSAGNVEKVRLLAVSLVSDPLPGYEARIVDPDPPEADLVSQPSEKGWDIATIIPRDGGKPVEIRKRKP